MIEVKITIPDCDVGDPEALKKRMALLGYAPPTTLVWKQVDNLAVDEALRDAMTHGTGAVMATAEGVEHIPHETLLAPEPVKAEAPKRGRAKKAEPAAPEPQPNISTEPENRVDPEAEAQDAADEAAEVAATPAKELTSEDLRAVAGQYIALYGIDGAQADGPSIFTDALGSPPNGAEMWNITLASKSPETLAKAVAAWEAAVAAGVRYGRS
jgi:hypothetical protein